MMSWFGGLLDSGSKERVVAKKNIRMCVLGLDNAGKTTILKKLS